MTETAAAQLRRILHVIPHLSDDEEHPIDEVAALAGVGRDTLLADLRSIVERFDEPGGFVEGLQIFLESERVSVMSSHFRRPMRLTLPELHAVELGLAMLCLERPPEEHAAIGRARERLRQIIAKLPADEVDEPLRYASVGSAGDVRHLAAVRGALRDRKKIRLSYRKGSAAESSARVICPWSVVAANGMWYVVAHCDESEGLRIFRLDRIDDVEQLAAGYEVPDDFAPAELFSQGKAFVAEAPPVMTVRYSPRIARWIAEREGAVPDADGSVTLQHPLPDLDWGARHVLQYGVDAEALAPEELRSEIVRRLEAVAG